MEKLRVLPLAEANGALAILNGGATDAETIEHSDLVVAFSQTEFGAHVPDGPSPRACLSRAVEGIRNKHRNADRLTGARVGYQITHKQQNDSDDLALEYSRDFSVYLEEGRLRTTTSTDNPVFCAIRARFDALNGKVDLRTLKLWVQAQLCRIGAVKIADHGHAYFVPPGSTTRAESLRTGLGKIAQLHVALIGVGAGPDLVDTVLRGLAKDTEQMCQTTYATCFGSDNEPGERAVKTQLALLSAAKTRLDKYAAILGRGLPDVLAKIDDVKAAVVAAHMATEPAWEETTHA